MVIAADQSREFVISRREERLDLRRADGVAVPGRLCRLALLAAKEEGSGIDVTKGQVREIVAAASSRHGVAIHPVCV